MISTIAALLFSLFVPGLALAVTPSFHLHYASPPVPVPGSTPTSSHLDPAVPGGATVKTLQLQSGTNTTVDFPTFTSTAFTATALLEPLVTTTVHLAANAAMRDCVQLTATLSRVSSAGVPSVLGIGSLSNQTVPRGISGGTQDFAPFALTFPLTAPDRSIPVGAAIALKVSVTNNACGNRNLFFEYDAIGAPSRVDFPLMDVFGAAATFGTLGATTSSGESVNKVAYPGWQFDPGQSAWFTAATSDGTVFSANYTQTASDFYPTACSMGVTCFNPDAAVCRAGPGDNRNFATIRIPAGASGTTFNVPPGNCTAVLNGACSGGGVCTSGRTANACSGDPISCSTHLQCEGRGSGASIGDLEVIGASGSERVVFNSAFASGSPPDDDAFPTFGTIAKVGGAWSVETRRFPYDLCTSNGAVSASACRVQDVGCFCGANCSPGGECIGGTCSFDEPGIECQDDGDCAAGLACDLSTSPHACRRIDIGGVGESTRMPQSGRVILGEYTNHRLIAVDGDGTVLGVYVIPIPSDPCVQAPPVPVLDPAPRQLEADPTSVLGDERFVVVYDTFLGGAGARQAIQEFKYVEGSPNPIQPVSAPVYPSSSVHPDTLCPTVPSCDQLHKNGAGFDHQGNLWITRATCTGPGPVAVYLKDPTTGKRKLEAACNSGGWGTACTTDIEVGLQGGTPSAPDWSVPWPQHILEDPTSGTMFVVTFAGELVPIQRSATATGMPFTTRDKIVLGIDKLNSKAGKCSNNGASCSFGVPCALGAFCLTESTFATKSVVDAARRALWVPVGKVEPVGPFGCGFFDCQYEAGELRDSWLYRVNLDNVLRAGVRPIQIQSPSTITITSGTGFTVQITTNLGPDYDHTNSIFVAYVNGSGTPAACSSPSCKWSQQCAGGTCTYTANVPASVTQGTTGSLVWHAFLTQSPTKSLHSVGRVNVTP